MKAQIFLSRDDKKIRSIEKIFERQEERLKRKRPRHSHKIAESEALEPAKKKEQLPKLCKVDSETAGNKAKSEGIVLEFNNKEDLSLIHICRCRRYAVCRSRWSPYH
eukprot:TRINITY_DN17071_c0_g1_i2.p2 TRINITY_DN17071_c0_g1~~TRINITY_DN17071_c0_g1_i2.p2  ORF type:complete len:107 (+),score=22.97 TRINITY_DN17071_c0_g1_i2:413-733(+)